jgi:hypothetical protein
MTLEEDVREAFARAVEPIVPDPDPMGRLLRRRRRRRVGLSSIVVVVVCAAVAVTLAGRSLSPRPVTVGDEYTITSSWTRRLLDSPTRGNLAHHRPLVEALGQDARAAMQPPPQLDRTHVLFVGDVGARRVLAVAFSNDTTAMLYYGAAPAGASASALLHANGMVGNVRIEPFTIVQPESEIVVGLAPAGCEVAVAGPGELQPDGTMRRVWTAEPTGDYVVRDTYPDGGPVRVTCTGVVRYQGPLRQVYGMSPNPRGEPVVTSEALDGARGEVEPDLGIRAAQLLVSLAKQAGVPVAGPHVVWFGRDPDQRIVVATAPTTGGILVVVTVGEGSKVSIAQAITDSPEPGERRDDWSTAATGTSTNAKWFAVRLPKLSGTRATLGDRVLVVGQPTAATAGVGDTRTPLTDGVGIITVPSPFTGTVTARSADGQVLAEIRVPDGLFGEPIVNAW